MKMTVWFFSFRFLLVNYPSEIDTIIKCSHKSLTNAGLRVQSNIAYFSISSCIKFSFNVLTVKEYIAGSLLSRSLSNGQNCWYIEQFLSHRTGGFRTYPQPPFASNIAALSCRGRSVKVRQPALRQSCGTVEKRTARQWHALSIWFWILVLYNQFRIGFQRKP